MTDSPRMTGETFRKAFEAVLGCFAGIGCVILGFSLLLVLVIIGIWKGEDWYRGYRENNRARHVARLLLPNKDEIAALKESELKGQLNAFITTACYGGLSVEAIQKAVQDYHWSWPGPCPNITRQTRQDYKKICDFGCRKKLKMEIYSSNDSEEFCECFFPCLENYLRIDGVIPNLEE